MGAQFRHSIQYIHWHTHSAECEWELPERPETHYGNGAAAKTARHARPPPLPSHRQFTDKTANQPPPPP